MIPSLGFSVQEQSEMSLSAGRIEEMAAIFSASGCLLLKDIFPMGLMQQLYRHLLWHYRRYLLPDAYHDDALRVGESRWMVTLKLKGPFADPLVFAHPLLWPLFRHLLGEEMILNSFGGVLSLPGAKAQHEHRDLPALFGDHPIDAQMPCFALTLMIPLVECNEHNGTTMLRVGSHLVPEKQAEQMQGELPIVPVGSCLLMDYRLHHGGTPNHSEQARPLIYAVYSRPWLRDYRNFKKQHPLLIPRRVFRGLSETQRALLATAHQTWW